MDFLHQSWQLLHSHLRLKVLNNEFRAGFAEVCVVESTLQISAETVALVVFFEERPFATEAKEGNVLH